MTVIKCQHSQIEFEAKSKRTKQHPLVAEFKNEAASKRGDYRLASQALEKAAKAGGYETIEEYMKLVNDIYSGNCNAKREAERKQANEEQEWQEVRRKARAKREAQNSHLKEYGYTWKKEYSEEYPGQWDEGNTPQVWTLRDKNKRQVTVAQALDEIERGAGVVQTELAELIETGGKLPYDVILDDKLAAADDRRKQAEKAAKQSRIDEWRAVKDEVKSAMTEVERFDYDGWKTTFNRSNHETITTIEKIFVGQINGIDCAVIYRYSGGHDYNETKQFYSADPEAAGLKVIERDELEASWHRLFGQ